MLTRTLGLLQKVELRSVWSSESSGFTPWLAQEQNLKLLGEALDLELELEAQERNVGPFRADILCKELNTHEYVLIENQLEKTDHIHLGQIITYAAGLKAVTIIWVAAQFTEEHRAAIDWLNEITDENINFFGIEIELWRIGDSLPAPKFNIVSKPNSWTHAVEQAARQAGDISETQKLQLSYWTFFHDFMLKRHGPMRPQKPFPQHWMNFAIGRSNFSLSAITNTVEKRIGVGLIMDGPNAKAHFKLLQREAAEIEQQFGATLRWKELPTKTQSHIYYDFLGCDLTDQKRWNEYAEWMAHALETFHRVLRPRIMKLNADDYVPPDSTTL